MFHSDADFLGAVTQDAALMQAAGINAVRTYTLVTDRAVLDVLQEHGIHLLNTVYRGHEDLDVEVGRIQEVMDHPAILMWVIGNEWNDQHCYASLTHEQCRERIKEGVRRVKAADATRPVATVYGKLPSKDTVADLEGVGVDVWGINYYNGTTFGELFSRWADLSEAPMFLGEFGADAWNTQEDREDLEAQAKATRMLTQEIVDNSVLAGGVCSGGMIFEFADEWWKDWTSTPSDHSTKGFTWIDMVADTYGPYPDQRFNEEWWGIVDIERQPRPAYEAYKAVEAPSRRLAGEFV